MRLKRLIANINDVAETGTNDTRRDQDVLSIIIEPEDW
jgi:hypothetical protein